MLCEFNSGTGCVAHIVVSFFLGWTRTHENASFLLMISSAMFAASLGFSALLCCWLVFSSVP